MTMITTFGKDTQEFKKLEAVAKMLEVMSEHNAQYVVEDVYFDYGQDWKWTTICRYGYQDCQVLSPREHENIMFAETPVELAECVEEIRNGRFFTD